jgi:hypothetical protein
MTFLSRLVREPLVHFVLIGAAVFALYALTREANEGPRDRIVVTEGRVQQLAQVFAKTWQRPPTSEELRGLIDAYIEEEVYYREALKLGLDRDDTLIRRRMQQKMEFLIEPGEDLLAADDSELKAFLDMHKAEFRVEPRIAFEQVFINPESGDTPAAARASAALGELRAGEPSSNLGDPTLLPEGQWLGPIDSTFGLHLVRITERADGYDPPLDEIREAIEQKWRTQKREAFQMEEYARLRGKYDVILPSGTAASPQAESAP